MAGRSVLQQAETRQGQEAGVGEGEGGGEDFEEGGADKEGHREEDEPAAQGGLRSRLRRP